MSTTTLFRAIGLIFGLGLLPAGCDSGPPPARFLDPCATDVDCESGQCLNRSSGPARCTRDCGSNADCESPLRICGAAGHCDYPCPEGDVVDRGANARICVDGTYEACSTRDASRSCETCGCEPFGGGICVRGVGCVEPRADGEDCTTAAECISGACIFATRTCGAPREQGGSCNVDADCASRNCSTDGDETIDGQCNQPLGTACRRGDSTCTNCIQPESFLDGMCARRFCDPVHAPSCPAIPRRQWECQPSTDGRHRCYEACTDRDYSCFERFDFCRDGYCQ